MTERYINPRTDFELKQYEDSQNAYRDIVNAINTAKKDSFAEGIEKGRAEGIEKGRAEGRAELIKMMKQQGVSSEDISRLTGLSIDEIECRS